MVFDQIFMEAVQDYKSNLKFVLSFGVLLVFVLFFVLYSNMFVSSGSVFFEFGSKEVSLTLLAIEYIAIFIFLTLYSFFSSLLIFYSKSKNHKKVFYFRDRMLTIMKRMLLFNVLYVFILSLIGTMLTALFLPSYIVTLVLLVLSIPFFFMPQSITVDEESFFSSLLKSIDFMLIKFDLFIFSLATGFVLMALVPLIELAFDQVFFLGKFISLLLVLLVVMPFIEVLKTKAYLRKYNLYRAPIEY